MNLRSHSISSLQGVLTVPGDKSISHRAAILGGLAKGVTEVDNFLCSEDCLNTLRAMEQLGAKVEVLEEREGLIFTHSCDLCSLSRIKKCYFTHLLYLPIFSA